MVVCTKIVSNEEVISNKIRTEIVTEIVSNEDDSPTHEINSDTKTGNDFDTIAQSRDNNIDGNDYDRVDNAKLQFECENSIVDLDGIQRDLSHVGKRTNIIQ